MLGQTPEARQAIRDDLFRRAQPHIVAYAMAAGGAGAVPLPVVDVPLVLAAQARMLHEIAEIYRQPMDLRADGRDRRRSWASASLRGSASASC